MPDESCRSCGGKLAEHTKCTRCMKSNSMICVDCALYTIEQFHSICTSVETKQTNTVPLFKSGIYFRVVAMA
ncbi:MAG: hypothetical protein EA447_05185 [Nitrosopumilus sp.]|nr:MAG: hypothetical protein EA447_05185 [Nitrosopumilus sp.]